MLLVFTLATLKCVDRYQASYVATPPTDEETSDFSPAPDEETPSSPPTPLERPSGSSVDDTPLPPETSTLSTPAVSFLSEISSCFSTRPSCFSTRSSCFSFGTTLSSETDLSLPVSTSIPSALVSSYLGVSLASLGATGLPSGSGWLNLGFFLEFELSRRSSSATSRGSIKSPKSRDRSASKISLAESVCRLLSLQNSFDLKKRQ
mmetsp:Transcript_3761/g.5459  ORF Transcript_3761/g.5459 Transcript_3761/m.5459 type:complete len:205 (+) Transcript_3761:2597-3211(+)